MDLKFLVSIFPIVFMFHDFEEIIFFKTWLTKNKDLLQKKFPAVSKRILPHINKLSTAAFSLAVAEEFILLSIITSGFGRRLISCRFKMARAFSVIHFVVE